MYEFTKLLSLAIYPLGTALLIGLVALGLILFGRTGLGSLLVGVALASTHLLAHNQQKFVGYG